MNNKLLFEKLVTKLRQIPEDKWDYKFVSASCNSYVTLLDSIEIKLIHQKNSTPTTEFYQLKVNLDPSTENEKDIIKYYYNNKNTNYKKLESLYNMIVESKREKNEKTKLEELKNIKEKREKNLKKLESLIA